MRRVATMATPPHSTSHIDRRGCSRTPPCRWRGTGSRHSAHHIGDRVSYGGSRIAGHVNPTTPIQGRDLPASSSSIHQAVQPPQHHMLILALLAQVLVRVRASCVGVDTPEADGLEVPTLALSASTVQGLVLKPAEERLTCHQARCPRSWPTEARAPSRSCVPQSAER